MVKEKEGTDFELDRWIHDVWNQSFVSFCMSNCKMQNESAPGDVPL